MRDRRGVRRRGRRGGARQHRARRRAPVRSGTAWATALATPSRRPRAVHRRGAAGPAGEAAHAVREQGRRSRGDAHASLTWGAAQAGVASGVADAVADGVIARARGRRARADRRGVGGSRGARRRRGVPQQPRRDPRGARGRARERAGARARARGAARAAQSVLPNPKLSRVRCRLRDTHSGGSHRGEVLRCVSDPGSVGRAGAQPGGRRGRGARGDGRAGLDGRQERSRPI